jgi:hypothetical protein
MALFIFFGTNLAKIILDKTLTFKGGALWGNYFCGDV